MTAKYIDMKGEVNIDFHDGELSRDLLKKFSNEDIEDGLTLKKINVDTGEYHDHHGCDLKFWVTLTFEDEINKEIIKEISISPENFFKLFKRFDLELTKNKKNNLKLVREI